MDKTQTPKFVDLNKVPVNEDGYVNHELRHDDSDRAFHKYLDQLVASGKLDRYLKNRQH